MATYKVQQGDTLSAIASKYGVSTKDITGYSSGNPNLIKVGEVLTIGGGSSNKTTTSSTSGSSSKSGLIQFTDAAGRTAWKTSDGKRVYTENGTKDTGYDVAGWDKRQLQKYGSPQSSGDVNSYLDSFSAQKLQEASTVKVRSTGEILQEIKTILPDPGTMPEAPKTTEVREKLNDQYGVRDLEQSLNDLKAEEQDILSVQRARKNTELNKPVATDVISGRMSEVDRQEAERIDLNNRLQMRVTDQLKTAYTIIDQYVKDGQTDFENGVKLYETKFNQSLNLINLVRGIQKDELDEQQRVIDNARANLTVFYNAVSSGNLDFSKLPKDTKLEINKLEIQSGIGLGFISSLNKKPAEEIKSITTREDGNGKYADMIIVDSTTGKVRVESKYLGASGSGSSGTGSSAFRSAIEKGIGDLKDGESWGTVWNRIKTQFPEVDNTTIDNSLGTSWREGGAYEKYKSGSLNATQVTDVNKAKQAAIKAGYNSDEDMKRIETDQNFRNWIIAKYSDGL